jgi:hypothetical protein
MLAEPSLSPMPSVTPSRAVRATFAGRLKRELFFAIVWAGENSRRSFILPLFRETLPAWGMLGV